MGKERIYHFHKFIGPFIILSLVISQLVIVRPGNSEKCDPTRSFIDLQAVEDQEIQVGDWLNITIVAIDPDGDELFFEVFFDERLDINLNNNSGELTFYPIEENIGTYQIVVTVTDFNGSYNEDGFNLEVKHRNYPPVVEPIPALTTKVGERIGHKLVFSDPNGDDVTVSIEYTDTPFTVDFDSFDFLSIEPGPGTEGNYHVLLNFSDNNGTFTLIEFSINVLFTNNPPYIIPIPNHNIEPGQEFNYQVNATDGDPDTLTYSIYWDGIGFATIDGAGHITIIPEENDVGNHSVVVTVDDNNGSRVTDTFLLYVDPENSPPLAPSELSIQAEAGDVKRVYLDAVDPEMQSLAVFGFNVPVFVEIDERSLSLIIKPFQDHIGSHHFRLYFLDDAHQKAGTNITLIVSAPQIPVLDNIGTIEMLERETFHLDLDWGYDKNGTVWYSYDGVENFSEISDSIIMISPMDGEAGEYTLSISYGIVNASNIPVQNVKLVVRRNLSTLWFKVHLEPDRLEFKYGERIDAEMRWGGYNSSLKFQWVWEVDDMVFERCYGKCSSIYTNISGNWNIFILLDGVEQPVYSKSFNVKEEEKSSSVPWSRIFFNFIIGLILVAAGIWGFFMLRKLMRYRDRIREIEDQDEPLIPEGFRSGPGADIQIDAAREQVFSTELRGNHYTEAAESTFHDASDLRGKEGPQESSQTGFRQG